MSLILTNDGGSLFVNNSPQIGPTGPTGSAGINAAASISYILQSTSGGDVSGRNYFTTDSTFLSSTNTFVFAYVSLNNISSEGFWNTIKNSITNGQTVYLQITELGNPGITILSKVNSVDYSDPGNFGEYTVTCDLPPVSATGNWNASSTYVVSFNIAGSIGDTGSAGQNGVNAATSISYNLQSTGGGNVSGSQNFTTCCNVDLIYTNNFVFAYRALNNIISEGMWNTVGAALTNGQTVYLQITQANNPSITLLSKINSVIFNNPGNDGQYTVTCDFPVSANGSWTASTTYVVSFNFSGPPGPQAIANINKVNLSSYQGSIDSNGNLNLTLPSNSINMCVNDANINFYSALSSGTSGQVNATVIDSLGNLYIGGNFSVVGGIVANSVAKWDGSSWSALGSGMNNTVNCLAVDSANNLYAGGNFGTAGGVSVNFIAKWDGSSWSALGSGMNGAVNALAVDSANNLYAGGGFNLAGGVSANRIAKWDGLSWSPLLSGMNNVVNALAVDSANNLYAGGGFGTAGGVSVNFIAKWDGSSWSALLSGMNSLVNALAVDSSNNLYAGGNFSTAGGVSANRIARWNGSSWFALGSGINGQNNALAVDSANNLYAGGLFTVADTVPAIRLAKWNGSVWTSLGNGLSGATGNSLTVMALRVDSSNNLYVGGLFPIAGGITSNNIAKVTFTPSNNIFSINLSVNSKLVYSSLCKNQTINVMVDSDGTAYGSGLYT